MSTQPSASIPETFTSFRIHQRNGAIHAGFETLSLADLSAGDVVIAVSHSSINYKDALAATGKGRILRRFPLVGGVDLAGTVLQSADARFTSGQSVLVTGCGLSETLDGGYSEVARVPADAVIPLPAGFSAADAMAVGTAGFSAALAIDKMERNGLAPARGEVLVTGATGGVGSVAVDMLSARGYAVVAVTGRDELGDYLRSIGAREVMPREELTAPGPPLGTARWAGAIDNLGGVALERILASLQVGGSVCSIGLAADSALKTTVMPFILRGVNLLGVNSAGTLPPVRQRIWQRIAGDLRPRHLVQIVSRTVAFRDLPAAFAAFMQGRAQGRTVVRIADPAVQQPGSPT
jgi:NADPH2:quinone reductase